jgi:beta-xylosidase
VVEDEKGDFYLMYHAYHADSFVYVGRQAVLDKLTFSDDGWPVVNGRKGTAYRAAAPEDVPSTHSQYHFVDEFTEARLNPEWQWPQSMAPRATLAREHGGTMTVRPDSKRGADLLGGVLAVKTTSGQYSAETVLRRDHWEAGTVAGLSAFGDLDNALGLAFDGEKLRLWRRAHKKDETVMSVDAPTGERLFLKLNARDGHKMTFSMSADGQNWQQVAPEAPLEGNYLPPWDRGIRVALTVGGGTEAAATFEAMRVVSEPPRLGTGK